MDFGSLSIVLPHAIHKQHRRFAFLPSERVHLFPSSALHPSETYNFVLEEGSAKAAVLVIVGKETRHLHHRTQERTHQPKVSLGVPGLHAQTLQGHLLALELLPAVRYDLRVFHEVHHAHPLDAVEHHPTLQEHGLSPVQFPRTFSHTLPRLLLFFHLQEVSRQENVQLVTASERTLAATNEATARATAPLAPATWVWLVAFSFVPKFVPWPVSLLLARLHLSTLVSTLHSFASIFAFSISMIPCFSLSPSLTSRHGALGPLLPWSFRLLLSAHLRWDKSAAQEGVEDKTQCGADPMETRACMHPAHVPSTAIESRLVLRNGLIPCWFWENAIMSGTHGASRMCVDRPFLFRVRRDGGGSGTPPKKIPNRPKLACDK